MSVSTLSPNAGVPIVLVKSTWIRHRAWRGGFGDGLRDRRPREIDQPGTMSSPSTSTISVNAGGEVAPDFAYPSSDERDVGPAEVRFDRGKPASSEAGQFQAFSPRASIMGSACCDEDINRDESPTAPGIWGTSFQMADVAEP
jgi:hypothetical protein